MREVYGTIASIAFGLSIGLAFGWADHLANEGRLRAAEARAAELGGELNAMRVMVEWERFEEARIANINYK